MKGTILITGASAGIGYGAAGAFIRHGYRVIATVRSQADADRLRAEIPGDLHPVLCDVTQPGDVTSLPGYVRDLADGHLAGLINNAGIAAGPGPIELQQMADIRAQFEVNVFGLMAVTQTLLPFLGTAPNHGHPPGRILNISSVGGLIASPFITPYGASKHAVEGFSHGLRRELRLFGIKVIIIGPGAIKTAIWGKNRAAKSNPFRGTRYEQPFDKFVAYAGKVEASGATPDEIGEFLVKVHETPHPRARYAFVPGKFLNWTLPVSLPHLWLDKIIGRTMGLERGN